MKVLIVKTSALGDVVHALPAAVYLKNTCPDLTLDWLVEESFAEILEPLPYLDSILMLNSKALRKRKTSYELGKFRETIRLIRRKKYDVVLDLQGNIKSGFFSWVSGASSRFGFSRSGVREWPNLLASHHKVNLGPSEYHIADRSLAIARAAFPGEFFSVPDRYLEVPEKNLQKTGEWMSDHKIEASKMVVCHMGTTWKTKLWPEDRWNELVAWLINECRCQPVLTWGNQQERTRAEKLWRVNEKQSFLWPGGNLGDLMALLQDAALVIGSDTGPIHMAAALGTPTVSFYRVTDSLRNGPRGPKHICIQAPLECSPCLLKECRRDNECGHSIHSKEVQKAVKRQLCKLRNNFNQSIPAKV